MEEYILKVFNEEVLDELTLDTIRGGGICPCNGSSEFSCSCFTPAGFSCECNGKSTFTCDQFKPIFTGN